jgi:hypothetical protein
MQINLFKKYIYDEMKQILLREGREKKKKKNVYYIRENPGLVM